MDTKRMISIWFFIGVLLLAYGVLITASGIYGYLQPAGETTVLANLHAGIWWGLLILLMGLFYTVKFYPRAGK